MGEDGFKDSPIVKTLSAAGWGSIVLYFHALCAAAALEAYSRSHGGVLAVPRSIAVCSAALSCFAGAAALHAGCVLYSLFSGVHPRTFGVQLPPDEVRALLREGPMLKKVSNRARWFAWVMRAMLLGRLLLCVALMSLPVFTGGLFAWVTAAGGLGASMIVLLMSREPQPQAVPGPGPEPGLGPSPA